MDSYDGNFRIFPTYTDGSNGCFYYFNHDCSFNINGKFAGDTTGSFFATNNICDGYGNVLSEIGNTINVAFTDLSLDGYTAVQASLSMTKLSMNRANIIINYCITGNTSDKNKYNFIDMSKVKSALNLSSINFSAIQTSVNFNPSISFSNSDLTITTSRASKNTMGYTGLLFGDNGGLGRIYNNSGSFGAWDLSNPIYTVDTYGTIIINSAYIAR